MRLSPRPRALALAAPIAAAAAVAAASPWLLHEPEGGGVLAVLVEEGAGRSWIAQGRPGGGLRVLTEGLWSASSPSPSFDARRVVFAGRRSADDAPRIWEMRIDGSRLREITSGFGDPADPAYLPGGRIVFSDLSEARPGGADGGPAPRALYACAPDGSDVQRLTFGALRNERPEVLPDGRVRFTRIPAGSGPAAPAIRMTVHPDGTGVALSSGDEPDRSTAPDAAPPPAGSWSRAVVSVTSAAPRREPPILTSVVNPERRTGTLLCLDVYTSRRPEIAGLRRGAIATARIAAAAAPGSAAAGRAVFLGEAPVHPDGSFFVEVPADTPLEITLVSGSGREVASMASGIWVRPNENRGCVGCHEPPHLAPENRRPLAVSSSPAAALGAAAGGGGAGAR